MTKKKYKMTLGLWSSILCLAACGKAVSSYKDNPKYEIENTQPITKDENEITLDEERMNVAFLQATNLETWRVEQSESFYVFFGEDQGFHLNIMDAHGDAKLQEDIFLNLIHAPMDIIFMEGISKEYEARYMKKAKEAGIDLYIFYSTETQWISGEDARTLIDESLNEEKR